MYLTKIIAQLLFTVFLSSTIIMYPMKRSIASIHGVVLSQDLLDAVDAGQLSSIQSLQTGGHITDEQLIDCFFRAAQLGHIDILNYIAQKVGVSCLKADCAPYVALQSAAKDGRIETIKCILGLGITYVHDTLITAIDNGHADIVQEFINYGANVNGAHYHIKPSSVLGYALQKNNVNVLQTLLENGAKIHKKELHTIFERYDVNQAARDMISLYFPYLNDPFIYTEKTHYTILGVSKDVSASIIKQAYYALARLYHPDRGGTKINTEIFKLINNAYECLSDPSKKRLYDLNHSCCCVSFQEDVFLPACQVCRKDCFTVRVKSYPHSCCDNSMVLCDYCEKQYAQVSKAYLYCCDK
jgi:hypothetical protein